MSEAQRASLTLYQRSRIEDRRTWYEYKGHHRRCKAQAEQREASFQLAAGLRYTKPCAATICEPPEAVDGPLPHDLLAVICCRLAS